jgi:hypothetical protein
VTELGSTVIGCQRNNAAAVDGDFQSMRTFLMVYRWKNYFSQLLSADEVNDVRQMEICNTDSDLNPVPSRSTLILKFIK